MTTKLRLLPVSIIAVTVAASTPILAQTVNTPVGLWDGDFFNDNTPALSPLAQDHRICFFSNGTWSATTFPGWGGRWFQKGQTAAGNGDRVRLVGNYATGAGNDSAEIDFMSNNLMAGPWSEWRDDFSSLYWARGILTRIGACALTCTPVPEETFADAATASNPASTNPAPTPVPCVAEFIAAR